MNEPTQHTILILLQKYIENRCAKEELEQLFNWLKSPDNRKEFDEVSQALWKRIDNQLSYPEEKRRNELNKEFDILMQQAKAGKIYPEKKINISRRLWMYCVAALFIILLSITIGYFAFRKQPEITYEEIYAARGEMKEHTLKDGTHVILNAESKLIIPSDFNEENRNIRMVGEGFFDVTRDPAKPFIIENGSTKVKVLGTSFNVKSYREDDYINVTVSTGKVLVNISSIDLQLRIASMQHLSIRKSTGEMTKLSLQENKYNDWIKGILYFNREPISEVLKTINRKYHKNVILECKNCNHIISGTHDNKSLEAVVEAICFTTGLKSRNSNDGTIILYD